MRSFVAALVALVAAAHAAMFAPNGPVLELTRRNFDAEVRQIEKPTFVAFTAPWCGHCQRLAPEYTRAAAKLGGVVKLAYVDCENAASKALCGEFGIQGFPTIKLFPATKKRIPRDYMGERSAQALIDYAVDAVPLSAVRKLDASEVKAYVDAHAKRTVFVLFSSKSRSSAMYRAVALDYRKGASFVFVNAGRDGVSAEASSAAREIGATVDTAPTLVAVSGWDGAKGSVEQYKGGMNYKELSEWAGKVVAQASGKAKKANAKADANAKKADSKADANAKKANAKADVNAKKADSKADANAGAKGKGDSAAEKAKDKPTKPDPKEVFNEERLDAEVRRIMERARAGELDENANHGMLELSAQMRELIKFDWSKELHEKSEMSREEAMRVIHEPENADDAIALSENHLRDGFLHELKLIKNRLKTYKDENGRPLAPGTVSKEEEKHELVNRILDTLRRRAAERGAPMTAPRETEDSFDVHDEL